MSKTKHDWPALYREFLQSDMNKNQFFETHHLPTNGFARFAEYEAMTTFATVSVLPSDPVSETLPSITIRKGDWSIELEDGFNKQLLTDLLEVFRDACLD